MVERITPQFTCGAGLSDLQPRVTDMARPVRCNGLFGPALLPDAEQREPCRQAIHQEPGPPGEARQAITPNDPFPSQEKDAICREYPVDQDPIGAVRRL